MAVDYTEYLGNLPDGSAIGQCIEIVGVLSGVALILHVGWARMFRVRQTTPVNTPPDLLDSTLKVAVGVGLVLLPIVIHLPH